MGKSCKNNEGSFQVGSLTWKLPSLVETTIKTPL